MLIRVIARRIDPQVHDARQERVNPRFEPVKYPLLNTLDRVAGPQLILGRLLERP
jgi:hypothetical protein